MTKRLKGFEPSTFCMASRRSSQLSYSRMTHNYRQGMGAHARFAVLIDAIVSMGRRSVHRGARHSNGWVWQPADQVVV
jgi:hypothetical protein